MEDLAKKIGSRVRKLREENKINQSELAKTLNVTRSNISKYEKGEVGLNFDILYKLAKHFDVSMDYLFGLTEFKKDKIEVDSTYIILSKEAAEKGLTAEQLKTAMQFYEKVMTEIEDKKKS